MLQTQSAKKQLYQKQCGCDDSGRIETSHGQNGQKVQSFISLTVIESLNIFANFSKSGMFVKIRKPYIRTVVIVSDTRKMVKLN